MKLTATLLSLALAVSVSAQTPAAKPAAAPTAKPATPTASKTAAPAAKSATAAKPATGTATPVVHATPNGPSNIPVVHGIKKPLYSLSYIDTAVGTGPLAEPSVLGASQETSKIMFYTVHYTGWVAKTGVKFDSSLDRGSPITFPYGAHRVIPGWDTGFQGMHVGGKRRIFIPYQLAYGDAGRPPVIPAKADLIFDVELISVSDKPPTPPTPPAAQKSPTTPAESGAPKAPAAPAAAPAAPTAPAPAPAAAPKAPVATPAPAAPAKPATK